MSLPVPTPRRIVDLTLMIAEELPCWWSTHMPYQHKTFTYFTDRDEPEAPLANRSGSPYQTRWMLMDEHTGTHFDAPAHFVPRPGTGLPGAAEAGLITTEQVPLGQLQGPAAVIDVPRDLPAEPGVSPTIEPSVVLDHEREHGRITEDTVVLFRTGWDRHYLPGPAGSAYCHDPLVTKNGPGWPAPDVPAMELLVDRGVRCVGIDTPSMGSCHDGGPVHVFALSRGTVFVEALTALHELPARGAYFLFAPIRLSRGTGAPGRALAYLD